MTKKLTDKQVEDSGKNRYGLIEFSYGRTAFVLPGDIISKFVEIMRQAETISTSNYDLENSQNLAFNENQVTPFSLSFFPKDIYVKNKMKLLIGTDNDS